jgi:hypothetical protein
MGQIEAVSNDDAVVRLAAPRQLRAAIGNMSPTQIFLRLRSGFWSYRMKARRPSSRRHRVDPIFFGPKTAAFKALGVN